MSVSRSIRFTDEGWEAIQLAAQLAGTSASDFVRVAAISRAMFTIGRHGGTFPDALAEVYEATQRAIGLYETDARE